MKKCQVLPIEFVVRGFMTGVYILFVNPEHAAKQLPSNPTCIHYGMWTVVSYTYHTNKSKSALLFGNFFQCQHL